MVTISRRFALALVGTLLVAAEASAYEVPEYNPNYWNQTVVQRNNNCYNYAMNKRTDTFAQPGRAYEGGIAPLRPRSGPGGNPFEICDYVAWYALMDGSLGEGFLFNEADDPGVCAAGPGYTKVALVVAPEFSDATGDYHWYRRDTNGFWSHKPGSTAARNTDDGGRLITSPETASRGKYELFCGYYCTASTGTGQDSGVMEIE